MPQLVRRSLQAQPGGVGSGTASPAFPLDVQSTVTPARYAYMYYGGSGQNGFTGAENATGAVSIRAADLGLLRRLRITDYTMRDRARYGNRAFKEVDCADTFAYSPVRTVQAPALGGFAVQAYPQPFTAELSLLIRTDEAGPLTIALHDAVGRTLLTRRAALLPGRTTVPLPEAAALPAGMYVLSVTQNSYPRTVKAVREYELSLIF